ncbi:hypothetical protein lbkm_1225 [Lachnospiraceae bacterium KM106-2]|nr:hypothetical protein lbkm_1225 [Lachnospiraceae bacterium KM106-2]
MKRINNILRVIMIIGTLCMAILMAWLYFDRVNQTVYNLFYIDVGITAICGFTHTFLERCIEADEQEKK